MGDWDNIPRPLRLRIQIANLVFYLLGAIPRVCLLILGIFSVSEIRNRPLHGIIYLGVCLGLMGLDLRTASTGRQEIVGARTRLLLKVSDFFLYPIGVGLHALIFVVTIGCAYLVWDHHFGAVIGFTIGLIIICVGSQEVAESKEWLRADHFLVR